MTKKTIVKSKSVNRKGGSHSMVSGPAAGAVIGAALGGIAGVALSNEKTRKQVGKIASSVGEIAADVMDMPTGSASGSGKNAKGTSRSSKK